MKKLINKIRCIKADLEEQEELLYKHQDNISEKYVEVLLNSPYLLRVDYNIWCPHENNVGFNKSYNKTWYNNFLKDRTYKWKIRGINDFHIQMWEPWESGNKAKFELTDHDFFNFDSWKQKILKREIECKNLIEIQKKVSKDKKIENLKTELKILKLNKK